MKCVNPDCDNEVELYLTPFDWTVCESCIKEYYVEEEE